MGHADEADRHAGRAGDGMRGMLLQADHSQLTPIVNAAHSDSEDLHRATYKHLGFSWCAMTESATSSPPKDQDIFGNDLRLSGKYSKRRSRAIIYFLSLPDAVVHAYR